jgi:hypothetical protein
MAFWLVVEPPLQNTRHTVNWDCHFIFRDRLSLETSNISHFLDPGRHPLISSFLGVELLLSLNRSSAFGSKIYWYRAANFTPRVAQKKNMTVFFSDEIHSSKTKHRKNTRPNTQVVCRQILLWVVK